MNHEHLWKNQNTVRQDEKHSRRWTSRDEIPVALSSYYWVYIYNTVSTCGALERTCDARMCFKYFLELRGINIHEQYLLNSVFFMGAVVSNSKCQTVSILLSLYSKFISYFHDFLLSSCSHPSSSCIFCYKLSTACLFSLFNPALLSFISTFRSENLPQISYNSMPPVCDVQCIPALILWWRITQKNASNQTTTFPLHAFLSASSWMFLCGIVARN